MILKILRGCFSVECLLLVLVSGPAMGESFYSPSTYHALVADHRAAAVGDALTVIVVETATAESSADTSSQAGFGMNASVTDAVGLAKAGASVDTNSSGGGKTQRAGSVKAQLSVRVERKLESGELFVKGSQLITVNGEQQRILVEGVVRPIDISTDNTVLSTRLVDAKIEYTGQGWVSRDQKPGLFSRFMHFLGL